MNKKQIKVNKDQLALNQLSEAIGKCVNGELTPIQLIRELNVPLCHCFMPVPVSLYDGLMIKCTRCDKPINYES